MKDSPSHILKAVGFWREHCGDMFPSVLSAPIDPIELSELEGVLLYLNNSPICVASPGIVYSAFDHDGVAGSASTRTDGVWTWHDTLAFYVHKHSLAIPSEFLAHIRGHGYKPPEEVDIKMTDLVFPW